VVLHPSLVGRPPKNHFHTFFWDLQVSVPYLRSEYGKEYDFDAPVKLLDSMMHAMADKPDQQVVVLCQVSNYILINLPALMHVGDQAMSGKALFQS